MNSPPILRLVLHLLKEGKLHHSGFDFTKDRKPTLDKLKAFCPPGYEKTPLTARVKHPVVRTLYSELSFIRRNLRHSGNHLNWPDASLAYIRIPRAGSTAVCKKLLEKRFGNLPALNAREVNHLTSLYLKRQLTEEDKHNTFFTIVRNPFARIVSVYREFFEKCDGPFLYEDYLFGVFRRDMSFRKFVQTLELIPDALRDQHLRSQNYFVTFYERKGVAVKTFWLERPTEIDDFLGKYGTSFDGFNMSGDYDYRGYYDARLAETVHRIYKRDISRFGYGEF